MIGDIWITFLALYAIVVTAAWVAIVTVILIDSRHRPTLAGSNERGKGGGDI